MLGCGAAGGPFLVIFPDLALTSFAGRPLTFGRRGPAADDTVELAHPIRAMRLRFRTLARPGLLAVGSLHGSGPRGALVAIGGLAFPDGVSGPGWTPPLRPCDLRARVVLFPRVIPCAGGFSRVVAGE